MAQVRYGVVGLGHIAQVAVLPAFAHARRNSTLVALVSDDPAKLRTLSRRYRVKRTYTYDEYEGCLQDVDAVYIALPNSMHAEYTIRAARAGVHVLCEKPMAVTAAECERMIAACREANVKLMVAYRLHFEELNLKAVELVRRGRIGTPKYFNSSFSMTVRPGNIRTKKALGGGTLYDIGVYCINAARYLFRSEPTEVMALSVNSGSPKLDEIDESTGAILRRTGKRDQFAPELLHFSDCIIRDRAPEPSGEEGLQDVRIVEALYESAETGKAVAIPPYSPAKRPDARQIITRPPVRKPSLVKVRSGSVD
jgi:glucose-fructose oxidoreductase